MGRGLGAGVVVVVVGGVGSSGLGAEAVVVARETGRETGERCGLEVSTKVDTKYSSYHGGIKA